MKKQLWIGICIILLLLCLIPKRSLNNIVRTRPSVRLIGSGFLLLIDGLPPFKKQQRSIGAAQWFRNGFGLYCSG